MRVMMESCGIRALGGSILVLAAACTTTVSSTSGSTTMGGAGGVTTASAGQGTVAAVLLNQLTVQERSAGWRLLFDGKTTTGWRQYQADTVPTAWHAADGTLTRTVGTRDIITRESFANFELAFEWKLATGGNAGVMVRVTEEYDHPYWTGIEYQLLDDANAPDGRSRLTAAGAAYGLYPAPPGIVKPADDWNSSRIVERGSHVEHWLNGQKLLEFELWTPEWDAKVKGTKFAPYANFGRLKTGHIAIQGDHNGALALRNIKIRVLP
jgi:hypothetical protein